MTDEQTIPKYPRIQHLVANSSVTKDDRVISDMERNHLFGTKVRIFEKLDGANIGITVINGQPIIRNRNHMLDGKQRALGNDQFSMLWQWVWKNIEKLDSICQNGKKVIYAEWLWKTHSVKYDRLEDWLVVFDILSYYTKDRSARAFHSPDGVKKQCDEHGLIYSPRLGSTDYILTEDFLTKLITLLNIPATAFNGTNRSKYSSVDRKEGFIIVPISQISYNLKYKIVREGFIQGEHWTKRNSYNELACEKLF